MPTKPTDAARVAREILARPQARLSVYPLAKVAGLRLLRAKRVLDRFCEVGWLSRTWDADVCAYRHELTDLGRDEMPRLLQPQAPGSSGAM